MNGWQSRKEGISAELTGPSFSHFKAALKDKTLTEVDTMLRSLSYHHGFSPKAWQRITKVQILKKVGSYHIDKMRTIMLMQAEFNMNNKFIGKIMMQTAEKFGLLAMEQFGSRNRHQSIAAALNKRLTYDLL